MPARNGLCILANFSEQFVLADDERELLDARDPRARRRPRAGDRDHHALQHRASAPSAAARAQALGAAMVMVMPPYHGATIRVPEARSSSSSRGCPTRSRSRS